MSKSPSLRRIQADIRELSLDPSDRYHAAPLENDMFEWHFTIRGADGTDFEGGYYHGRIILPPEYPFKPPNIVFLTPSGRFETNVKVCLSFSAYHPELWQPAWGIRLILEALVSFLPTKGDGAIGALDWSSEERKKLAKKSLEYRCMNPTCYCNGARCSDVMKAIEERIAKKNARKKAAAGGVTPKKASSRFQKEIEQLHAFQLANEVGDDEKEEEADKKIAADADAGASESTNSDGKENQESEIIDTTAQSEKESSKPDDQQGETDEECKEAKTEDVQQEAEKEGSLSQSQVELFPTPKDVIEEGVSEALEDESEGINNEHQHQQQGDNEVANEVADPQEQHQQEQQPQQRLESPLLSDPVVHTGIIIFSVIVYLLVRKINAIMEEMVILEAKFQQ
eukprot:839938_1